MHKNNDIFVIATRFIIMKKSYVYIYIFIIIHSHTHILFKNNLFICLFIYLLFLIDNLFPFLSNVAVQWHSDLNLDK